MRRARGETLEGERIGEGEGQYRRRQGGDARIQHRPRVDLPEELGAEELSPVLQAVFRNNQEILDRPEGHQDQDQRPHRGNNTSCQASIGRPVRIEVRLSRAVSKRDRTDAAGCGPVLSGLY